LERDARNIDSQSHVLLVESRVAKKPQTPRNGNDPTFSTKAILTLRLLEEGDVSMGTVFKARPERFYHLGGLTGYQMIGGAHSHCFGTTHQLLEADVVGFQSLYESRLQFEPRRASAWRNVAAALRSFSNSYARMRGRPADRVLDLVTLRAFLRLSPSGQGRETFYERVDSYLLHAARRDQLRGQMGLQWAHLITWIQQQLHAGQTIATLFRQLVA